MKIKAFIGYRCHVLMITFISVICATFSGAVPAGLIGRLIGLTWLAVRSNTAKVLFRNLEKKLTDESHKIVIILNHMFRNKRSLDIHLST